MFELRDYQVPLVDAADQSMIRGGVPCVVVPTGGGKTVIMSEIARRALERGERVVVVAHRQEIVLQIVKSLKAHLPKGTPIEIITAGTKAKWNRPVTVGMVPTLARRLGHLRVMQGCTLLQDECHHAGAKSWANVTAALAPNKRCGMTATPVRPNGSGLGPEGAFTELLIGPQANELMAIGALCQYKLFASPKMIDTKGLRKRGGDFAVSDMEKRVVEINGNVVPDWKRFNPDGASTIVVGVSVDHAHALAKMFQQAGVRAAAVDGSTTPGARAELFRQFRSGELTVMVACAVIDEGLDVPEATVLQVTRPTASLRLWRQLVGRVLRPSESKERAIVIDHTDNWRRLPLPDASIQWELNPEKKPFVMRHQVEIDPITNELKVGAELEVNSTGEQLQEITLEMISKSDPRTARRLFNVRLQQEITDVKCGKAEAESLRPWMARTPVLSEGNIAELAEAMQLPAGWVAGQIQMNSLIPGARRSATKAIQKACG